jgi:putative redox protein
MDLISVTRETGTKFAISVRGHAVASDMTEKDGGHDEGPSPVELFAGSLGACVAMMVQHYCDKHGYTDGRVEASLAIELADDPKRIGGIVIDLEIPKDVPENRMEAIKRLANRCPVHQTLENPPTVDIDIV